MLKYLIFDVLFAEMKKVSVNNLQISEELVKFVNEEVIPGTNLDVNKFMIF